MSTATYDRFRDRLSRTPYIKIDVDGPLCGLISRDDANKIRDEAEDGGRQTVDAYPLLGALEVFAKAAGKEDRPFGLGELAAASDNTYPTTDDWHRQGIIRSTVSDPPAFGKRKKFSWQDAFISACLGYFRRRGYSLPILRKLSDCLYDDADEMTIEHQPSKPAKETADA
jgi:hypothetical protein